MFLIFGRINSKIVRTIQKMQILTEQAELISTIEINIIKSQRKMHENYAKCTKPGRFVRKRQKRKENAT